jgi:hypothetical protein
VAFYLLQLLNIVRSSTIENLRIRELSSRSGIEIPYRAVKTNIEESLNIIVWVELGLGKPKGDLLRREFGSEVVMDVGSLFWTRGWC